MQFQIRLEGQKKLLDTTQQLDREFVKGIRGAVQTSARELRNQARRNVPKFQGNMRRAIRYRSWRRFLSATVFVDRKIAPHTHFVVLGRAPGLAPSPKDPRLAEWARRHGVPIHALVRAMARHGTRPAVVGNFMQDALSTLRAGIVARIRSSFEAAFRRAA